MCEVRLRVTATSHHTYISRATPKTQPLEIYSLLEVEGIKSNQKSIKYFVSLLHFLVN